MIVKSHTNNSIVLRLATTALMGCAGCGSNETASQWTDAHIPLRTSKQDLFDEAKSSAEIRDERRVKVEAEALRLPEFWHHMLSVPLEPEVRDRIVTMVNREFSRPMRSPASTMVRELNQALRDAGVSAEDAQATMGTFLKNSPFPFSETQAAWNELAAIYPEVEVLRLEAAAHGQGVGPFPSGNIVVAFHSSAGDRVETSNHLWIERRERRDAGWLPNSISEMPVSVEILVDSFVANDVDVKADDILKVEGRLTAIAEGTSQEMWSREIHHVFHAFSSDSTSYESAYELELKGADTLTGDAFRVDLELAVTHVSGMGEAKSRTVFLRQSRSFDPVYDVANGEQRAVGYLVQNLDPSGHRLKYPGVTTSNVVDVYRFSLGSGREVIRTQAAQQLEAESRLAGFIGSPLDRINLAYSPTGEVDVVKLDSEKTAIVVLGASWCGPCQELAPAVKELSKLLNNQGAGGAELFKFSVDEDPTNYAKELESYPSGIVTPEQWEATGLPGVPAYVVVESGMVKEAGILSPEKIAELAGRFGDAKSTNKP